MRVALAQIPVEGRVDKNLGVMCAALERAAEGGAQLVVFPECALTGYLGISLETLDALDPLAVHRALMRLSARCGELGVAAASGQYFKRSGRFYNNAVLFDHGGRLVASYDKCHLVDQDCYHVAAGAAPTPVVTLGGARVSLGVCHDIRYPEHVRSAALRGAEVHLHLFYGIRSPRDLRDQEIYDAHLATRAAENSLFVLAANVAIREQMVRSQARDPEGRLLARAAGFDEELLVVEVDASRAGDGWPAKRRSDLYVLDTRTPGDTPYFERGVWEKKPYMIDHDRSLLDDGGGSESET